MDRCAKCLQIPLLDDKRLVRLDHHESFSDLEAAAAQGCKTCRLFRREILMAAQRRNQALVGPCKLDFIISKHTQTVDFAVGEVKCSIATAMGSRPPKEVLEPRCRCLVSHNELN